MAYTLTAKSQVTLPKPIRDHLNVAPGDAVSFRIVADGSVRVEPAAAPDKARARALGAARKRFAAQRGMGGQSGQASTDALMNLLRGYDEDANDPALSPRRPLRRP